MKNSGTSYEYANAAFQSHLFEGEGPIPQSAKKPTASSVKQSVTLAACTSPTVQQYCVSNAAMRP